MGNVSKITLNEDEKAYLESIIRSGINPTQMIQRAKILLLLDKGVPVTVIPNVAGIKKEKVAYCLDKYKKGGAKYAVCDARRQGKNISLSDEEKAWIINIVRQRVNNGRFSDDFWNYKRFQEYIKRVAEEAGYARLSTISYTGLISILKRAGIQSRYLRYPER